MQVLDQSIKPLIHRDSLRVPNRLAEKCMFASTKLLLEEATECIYTCEGESQDSQAAVGAGEVADTKGLFGREAAHITVSPVGSQVASQEVLTHIFSVYGSPIPQQP